MLPSLAFRTVSSFFPPNKNFANFIKGIKRLIGAQQTNLKFTADFKKPSYYDSLMSDNNSLIGGTNTKITSILKKPQHSSKSTFSDSESDRGIKKFDVPKKVNFSDVVDVVELIDNSHDHYKKSFPIYTHYPFGSLPA